MEDTAVKSVQSLQLQTGQLWTWRLVLLAVVPG